MLRKLFSEESTLKNSEHTLCFHRRHMVQKQQYTDYHRYVSFMAYLPTALPVML